MPANYLHVMNLPAKRSSKEANSLRSNRSLIMMASSITSFGNVCVLCSPCMARPVVLDFLIASLCVGFLG